MKNTLLLMAAAAIATSCNYLFPAENGELSVAFSKEIYLATKASGDVPDTNSFFLTVTSSKGNVLYDGLYGSAPQPIITAPGSYTVKAVSRKSSAPAFEEPVYGDEQLAVIEPGGLSGVNLLCSQLNSGLRLSFDREFKSRFAGAYILITSEQGSLSYALTETRTAYFLPGIVNLQIKKGEELSPLLSRSLRPRENLSLSISAPGGAQGLAIQVDTSRNWVSEEYVMGSGTAIPGADVSSAMGVGEARQNPGAQEVWVYGYIAGGDLSSSKAKYQGPFTSKTNLLLSAKFPVSGREGCLSVQLQQGDTRDALNLVDNPQLLGKQVFLKGNIVPSYYGLPGIQQITEYLLREGN